jgi:hypothetical protein
MVNLLTDRRFPHIGKRSPGGKNCMAEQKIFPQIAAPELEAFL